MRAHPAIRTIYGSQVLFLSTLAALVVVAWDAARTRPILVGAALLAAAGYVQQSQVIFTIKTSNAALLRTQEQILSRQIRACESPCVIRHGNLNAGLEDDWVLHPDYWRRYLEYMQVKHGAGKAITFQYVRGFDGR